MTYAELIQALFPRLTGGIRWGLGRTERLLAEAGDPHRRFRTIHIGGTNGKGSVAASIESALRSHGVRTGLYTSPHLCTFRERIRIGGAAISEADLLAAAERLWPSIERETPSFFEATTVIAFDAFAAAGAEVVVVEVGLGGRLDATNVVDPELAILTNVELDHVEFLGETLEAIAEEKAGIIKPGRPVLVGERRPELRALFRRRAAERDAPYHELDPAGLRDIRVAADGTRFELATARWGTLALRTPLLGRHQAVNAALAVRGLELLPDELAPDAEAVRHGLARVRWPGRAQVEGIGGARWIFDAAHNPAGIEALLSLVVELHASPPLVAVVGVLRDKDWERMLLPLAARTETLVLTVPPTSPEERRWDPAAAQRRLAQKPGTRAAVEVIPDLGAALRRAEERGRGGTVLVTGSFHTAGDALAAFGLAPDGVDPALPAPARAV